jgi:hypothetical protein
MGNPQKSFANRGPVEVTSISTAITPAATSGGETPPITWIQVLTEGSGGLVVKDEIGTTRTYTGLLAGMTLYGPFTEITSMTCSKILYGDGKAPPPIPSSTVLGSTAAGQGASTVGAEDAGDFTEESTVEGQLQELYQHLFSAVGGYVPIPLSSFRGVSATGDVGDVAAIGGVLASDTTPIFDAVATSNEHEILWATGDVAPIGVSIALPRDFDDTADATLDLEVASGSTNAASIVCASAWSAGAAGTEVSDAADDAATKSATPHRVSVTIAHADIPAGARRVTFRLTPPTHATDAISLKAAGLAYKRKLLTS